MKRKSNSLDILTAHLQSYSDHLNDESFHLKCHCNRLFVNHHKNVFLSLDYVVPNWKCHWCWALQLMCLHLPLPRQPAPMTVKCLLSSNYHFDFDYQNYSSTLQPSMINCLDDRPAIELVHDLVYRAGFCTSVQRGKATLNRCDRIRNFRCALCTCCIETCQTCTKIHAVPILSI